jgi:hypothetical protein
MARASTGVDGGAGDAAEAVAPGPGLGEVGGSGEDGCVGVVGRDRRATAEAVREGVNGAAVGASAVRETTRSRAWLSSARATASCR